MSGAGFFIPLSTAALFRGMDPGAFRTIRSSCASGIMFLVSAYEVDAVLGDDQMWSIVKFIEDLEEHEGPLMFRDIMACLWLLLRMPAQRRWLMCAAPHTGPGSKCGANAQQSKHFSASQRGDSDTDVDLRGPCFNSEPHNACNGPQSAGDGAGADVDADADQSADPVASENSAIVLMLLARVCRRFMDDLERATCVEADVDHEDDEPAISLFEWMINGMWLALVDDEGLDPLPENLPLYAMEAAPGTDTVVWWTVPVPHVDPSVRPSPDDPTLRTLVACLALPYPIPAPASVSTPDAAPPGVDPALAPGRDAFWKIRMIALGCLWAVCARDCRVAATVAELGAVPHAVAITCDELARPELRLRASGFISLMSDNVELHVHFPGGTPACVEVAAITLLRSEHWDVADEGCRGVARAAFRPAEDGREPGVRQKLSTDSRRRLNDAGAPDLVLAHVRRVHERALASVAARPSCAAALTALLNLSASKECQVSICKGGLLLLLRIHAAFLDISSGGCGTGPDTGFVRRRGAESDAAESAEHLASMAAAIIENLALNSENRTRFYRAELRGTSALVSRQVAAAAGAEGGDVSGISTPLDQGLHPGSPAKPRTPAQRPTGPGLLPGLQPREIVLGRNGARSPGRDRPTTTSSSASSAHAHVAVRVTARRFEVPEWCRHQHRSLSNIVAKAATGTLLLPREAAALREAVAAAGREADGRMDASRLDPILVRAAAGKVLTKTEKFLLKEASDGDRQDITHPNSSGNPSRPWTAGSTARTRRLDHLRPTSDTGGAATRGSGGRDDVHVTTYTGAVRPSKARPASARPASGGLAFRPFSGATSDRLRSTRPPPSPSAPRPASAASRTPRARAACEAATTAAAIARDKAAAAKAVAAAEAAAVNPALAAADESAGVRHDDGDDDEDEGNDTIDDDDEEGEEEEEDAFLTFDEEEQNYQAQAEGNFEGAPAATYRAFRPKAHLYAAPRAEVVVRRTSRPSSATSSSRSSQRGGDALSATDLRCLRMMSSTAGNSSRPSTAHRGTGADRPGSARPFSSAGASSSFRPSSAATTTAATGDARERFMSWQMHEFPKPVWDGPGSHGRDKKKKRNKGRDRGAGAGRPSTPGVSEVLRIDPRAREGGATTFKQYAAHRLEPGGAGSIPDYPVEEEEKGGNGHGDVGDEADGFHDAPEVEVEEDPEEEEEEERIGLVSLQQQLRRPLSHLWALPRQRVAGHGNNRWTPAISYYRTSSIGGDQNLLGEANRLLRVKRPPEVSRSLELGMVQQAMLRRVGPKWGRGVMPDQSDASDLDGLLHLPESNLERLEKASRSIDPPPRVIAPSAPPMAMLMPPKSGLRNLGRPDVRKGAGLNERSAAIVRAEINASEVARTIEEFDYDALPARLDDIRSKYDTALQLARPESALGAPSNGAGSVSAAQELHHHHDDDDDADATGRGIAHAALTPVSTQSGVLKKGREHAAVAAAAAAADNSGRSLASIASSFLRPTELDMAEGLAEEWEQRESTAPLEVILSRGRSRSRITFKRPCKKGPALGISRLSVFRCVPGSVIGSELPSYPLPNGERVHFYQEGAPIIDEVEVALHLPPARPLTLDQAAQRRLPQSKVGDYMLKPPPGVLPPFIRLPPPLCPAPKASVNHGRVLRIELTTTVASVFKETFEDIKPRKPWLINKSVFEPRRRESDAKAYLDTEAIEKAALAEDVSHVFSKPSFVTFFNGTCASGDRAAMNKRLRAAVEEWFQLITTCFSYYSGSTSGYGGEGIYSMGLNEWSDFTISSGVINDDAKAKGEQCNPQGGATLRRTDVDGVFIATNYEDKSSDAGGLQSQFMRHEFVEACIRVAVLVAREEDSRVPGADITDGNKGGTVDAGRALQVYLREYVERHVRKDIQHDPNDFRTSYLYFEEVDTCFGKYHAALKAMYNAYRLREQGAAAHRPKRLNPSGWDLLMKDTDLISTVSFAVLRLAMMQSRMLCANGIDRDRNTNLTFVDFLEALGRLAHFAGIPSMEELTAAGFGDTLEWHVAQQVVVSKERTKGNDAKLSKEGLESTLGPSGPRMSTAAAPAQQPRGSRSAVKAPAGKQGSREARALHGRGAADHLALTGGERPDVFDANSVMSSPGNLEARLEVLLDLMLRRIHYGVGQVAGDTSQPVPVGQLIKRFKKIDEDRGPVR